MQLKTTIRVIMAENQNLFADFPEISREAWQGKIEADLKGADFEKKLVWRTMEGFKLMPYYRTDDLKDKDYLNSLPGEFPYLRGTELTNDWEIRQDILVKNVSDANAKALDVLNKGVTALGFIIPKALSPDDFEQLLEGIVLESLPVYFISDDNTGLYSRLLADYVEKKSLDKTKIQGSENFDVLAFLAKNGFMPCGKSNCDCSAKLFSEIKDRLPAFRPIAIEAKYFQNSGSNLTQELGFALSEAVYYLDKLTDAGFDIDDIAKRIQFNYAVGPNYFIEIAKLRAARMLWAKLTDAYGIKDKNAAKIHMHVETAKWNMSVYDPYVNMLRATTECMSGILGGANSINVLPFSTPYGDPTVFSERIARNVQLILKEESHFGKVQDPAAGSYYIETLTDTLAENAWKLFLEIEDAGGFIPAFKENIIQDKIDGSLNERLKRMAMRKETILGTNQYPNAEEFLDEDIDINRLFAVQLKDSGNGRPLRENRVAEAFEAMRIKTDRSKSRSKVFLLTIGHRAMRSARAQFAANFFAVAGFEIVNNLGFDDIEAGVKAAHEMNAGMIVLCSSDDEYTEYGKQLVELNGGKSILAVAGNPACKNELEKAGIKYFIHVKTDILASLQAFQSMLGI
ncbi:MAG: methylmalonyl-CoA mutase family protein [Bacteroidales bacterium]|nr:methylmalonyl-CoA mutase family protein [Bacteroidales bacterium]